ncbi:hypothetical protein AB8U03_13585 [Clostridium sp. Mt-5]|uniref:Uncharacterized protein n=1 Tax=Clostridium moutaii TaxID=3240932 RepID=A0ABV4BR03_9CLOT
MGLKDFMKKMAEKQEESNRKIAENNAKYEAEKQERIEKNREKMRIYNEKCAQKKEERNAKFEQKQAKRKQTQLDLNNKVNELKEKAPNAGVVTLSNRQKEKQYQKERLQQLKKDHVPYCPKCHSTNLTYVAKRKRLSLGRTIVGGAVGSLAGPLGTATGAAMGGLSSDKMKKGKVKCLNCGHEWKL